MGQATLSKIRKYCTPVQMQQTSIEILYQWGPALNTYKSSENLQSVTFQLVFEIDKWWIITALPNFTRKIIQFPRISQNYAAFQILCGQWERWALQAVPCRRSCLLWPRPGQPGPPARCPPAWELSWSLQPGGELLKEASWTVNNINWNPKLFHYFSCCVTS